MVFFVCDGCNETLKKNKVDAHAAKCRDCYAVSCVDCSVSFPGDDYRTHTSCVTEAERYEKTVYKGARKADQNNTGKKLTKQEKWLATIEKAADSAPPALKSYMDTLASLENIPMQEKKFRNFAANSLRLKKSDEKIVTQIWELLVKEKQKEVDASKQQSEEGGTSVNTSDKEVSAKISDSENSKDASHKEKSPKSVTSNNNLPSDTNIKKTIKKVLKKSSNNKLKFKSLRKEVKESLLLKASDEAIKSTLMEMDDKKWKVLVKRIVKENPKMKLDGKNVLLVEC